MENPTSIQNAQKKNSNFIETEMEQISETNGRNEDPHKHENLEKVDNSSNRIGTSPSNPLLDLFVLYAWDEKHGQCFDSDKNKVFGNWLESMNIDVTKEFWYFSSKLDLRMRSIVEQAGSVNSRDSNMQKTQDSKDDIIYAYLAYSLRKFLSLLINGKGDVSYTNDKGQTVLHVLLEDCLEITENSPKEKLSKVEKLLECLIEMKAPLYAVDNDGKTPYHLAVLCKSRRIIKTMISCSDDLSSDENGNTALHILVENCIDGEDDHKLDYVTLARTLVSKGADVNAKNKKGVTPVHRAAEKFYVGMLELFVVNGGNLSLRTKADETPLHFASRSTLKLKDTAKMVETIRMLVSQGCDLEAVDKYGKMPLRYAAELGIIEIVEKLITLGANVDSRTTRLLMTPLYIAARSNRLDVMKKLIEAGADVNAEAKGGSTPIFMSAMFGNYESMQYLMDNGADLYRRDELTGFTLLHVVANDLHSEATADIQSNRLKKFNALMEKDFDVNDSGQCGITPLQLVILARNAEAVKILVERGAKVNFQSQALEWTALHVALMENHVEIVKILLENGADVNCRGGIDQRTPLHVALIVNIDMSVGIYPGAVEKGAAKLASPIRKFWSSKTVDYDGCVMDLVTLLIDKGADVNAEDALGETPIHWASLKKNVMIMKKILDAGAHVNVQSKDEILPLHNVLKRSNVEGLKLLLNFGAAINDKDTCELIRNSTAKLKNVAIQHAIKLNVAGLPINKVYEPLVQLPKFSDFRGKCSEEVKSLHSHNDIGLPLLEFLQMNTKRQRYYVQKVSDLSSDLEDQFPLYSGLIRSACRETENRKSLLHSARIAWSEAAPIDLTDVCVEQILSNINNRYLNVLASSIKNIEKVEDVEKMRKVFRYTHYIV